MADPNRNRRGIAWMVVAMGFYALNDGLVKTAAQDVPAGQLLAVRGAFATIVAAMFARAAWHRINARLLRHPLVLLRCGLEIATALTSVLALARAPLASVAAIMMTGPLLTVAISATLGEGWRLDRIATAFAAFVGVLLVAQPWSQPTSAGLGLGLAYAGLCALCLSARDLVTRRLPADLPTSGVAWFMTLSVFLAGTSVCLFERWSPLTSATLAALALAAAATAAGTLALIAACRESDLSLVTPYRYSLVVWAILIGGFASGDWPGPLAFAGMALICFAGACGSRSASIR